MPKSMVRAARRVRLFTRREYERMADEGIFKPDERVELVAGEILVMTPQRARHTTVLFLLADALREAFGPGHTVRTQAPLALNDVSEPEPDIAVVPGAHDDYADAHPSTALLIVEVSDTTLRFDRGKKAGVYAQAMIQDYWVVNLVDRVLEVHRDPHPAGKGVWSYRDVKLVKASESVRSLAAPPAAKIAVASFLR